MKKKIITYLSIFIACDIFLYSCDNNQKTQSKGINKTAIPAGSPTIDKVYHYLNSAFPQFDGITYNKPTFDNILHGGKNGNWLLQIPNIWGNTIDDYNTLFCNNNVSATGLTCDPCFNLPECSTDAQCSTSQFHAASCVLPNFLANVGSSTPLSCSNGTISVPQKLCMTQGQQNLLEQMYSAIVGANSTVDIYDLILGNELLTNGKDSFFYLFKKALTDLAKTGRHVTIRILGGDDQANLNSISNAESFLRDIVADFPSHNPLTIVAAPQRSCPDTANFPFSGYCQNPYASSMASNYMDYQMSASWNHAKSVVIDKRVVFTGGIDYWASDYVWGSDGTVRPVNDSMILIDGPVGQGASAYLDWLYTYLSSLFSPLVSDQCIVYENNKITNEFFCQKRWNHIPIMLTAPRFTVEDYKVKAMYVGKLNALYVDPITGNADQSEPARVYAISHAVSSVKIAQQSLFMNGQKFEFTSTFPYINICPSTNIWPGITINNTGATCTNIASANPSNTMEAIVDVFYNNITNFKNVDVTIIHSKYQDGTGYQSAVNLEYVYDYICASLMNRGLTVNQAQSQLQANLHLKNLSYNMGGDTAATPGNHNKFWMVDDHLFYFGSHNFYPAATVQSGIITDNKRAAFTVNEKFWNKLNQYADTTTENMTSFDCANFSSALPLPACVSVQSSTCP